MDKIKRVGNISNSQKEMMIEFMENHPDLKSGKFSINFTFKKAQFLWNELAELLNSLPGGHKDWKQWRRTWQDLRSKVKSKKAKILKERGLTGGGEPCEEELTEVEHRIVELVGRTAIEGHKSISESLVEFEFQQPIEMNCTITNDANLYEEEEETTSITFETVDSSGHVPTEVPLKKTQSKLIKKRPVRSERLNRTISATQKLAELNERELLMKADYYKEKLALLREDIAVKKKDIAVKQEISATLREIVENLF